MFGVSDAVHADEEILDLWIHITLLFLCVFNDREMFFLAKMLRFSNQLPHKNLVLQSREAELFACWINKKKKKRISLAWVYRIWMLISIVCFTGLTNCDSRHRFWKQQLGGKIGDTNPLAKKHLAMFENSPASVLEYYHKSHNVIKTFVGCKMFATKLLSTQLFKPWGHVRFLQV